jgi:large subunit ribosomal protein L10
MSVARTQKEEILNELQIGLKTAKIVIFVNFHGMGVAVSTKLRKLLREAGVKYVVAKKTLIKKALGITNIKGEIPNLEGEIAIAFSDKDSIELTKILEKFAKENKILQFAGGVYENGYISPSLVKELANIPSREILLGKLVYVISSPQRGLVVTLNGVIRNLVGVLSQIKK